MWQAYYEWLKLMVVHFDALRILISFQERVRKPITIKIISTPQPDKSLMPWKKLLENERYFHNQLLPTSAIIASFPICLAYKSIRVRRPPSTSDPIPFSGLRLIMDPCQWCHMVMVDTRTSLCHCLSSFLIITCITGFGTSFKHR